MVVVFNAYMYDGGGIIKFLPRNYLPTLQLLCFMHRRNYCIRAIVSIAGAVMTAVMTSVMTAAVRRSCTRGRSFMTAVMIAVMTAPANHVSIGFFLSSQTTTKL